jgi:isoquinoline 1-oxidoreductase alpha subunit
MTTLTLNVNEQTYTVNVSNPGMPLLWVLRDLIGLTGTKYGCGIEVCGACTVLIDNQREHSCVFDVGSAVGKKIVTVEGLSADADGRKAQEAWVANQVPQCGYCQPGMIMAVAALLKEKPRPTDADIDGAITNICRCGTFQQVRAAVHAAAKA